MPKEGKTSTEYPDLAPCAQDKKSWKKLSESWWWMMMK